MKKLNASLALGALLLILSAGACAQGVPTLADIKKVTDAAMERVGKGDLNGGLDTFKPLVGIPPAEFDAMRGQVVLQIPMMSARFGASIGHEFIEERRLGESLARFAYLHKFDIHATRWYFYAYRGKSGWIINTFRFDDKLTDMF
jgi:hypothetical protein